MPLEKIRPERIISGGQTGVDRGALDAAIALDIPHGGWCPPDRMAQDGVIPERYHVDEVGSEQFVELGFDYADKSDHYRVRTVLNIRDADGTLILTPDRVNLSPGTRLTVNTARKLGKPCIVLSPEDEDAAWRIEMWVRDQTIKVLNVAGPRESRYDGIQAKTADILETAFRRGG